MKSNVMKMGFYIITLIFALCILEEVQKVHAADNGYVHFDWWNDSKDKINDKYDVTGDGEADVVRLSLT